MKNFTNNFKQFTSRLSARWLIMALMMLVGTSSAWAVDYYLRGTFNDWSTNNKFLSNTCTITLAANQDYTFKIAASDWNNNNNTYGKTNSHITETCEIELLNNTNNQAAGDCKITTKDAGSYTFVFTPNGSKGTLKVTYPTPTPTPPTPTAPVVSTTSAVIEGENLVCKGKVTSMGSASTVVWAFTVLSTDAISKAHSDWKYPDGQNQITTANTDFEYSIPISSLSLTSGTTYYVRAMAVDLNNLGWADNQYGNAVAGYAVSFLYNPCIELPDDAYTLSSSSAEWTGSDITPTIRKKGENYPTPTITYNGGSTLPNKPREYRIKATVSGDATYCNKEFDLGTFTITCPTIAAPAITTSATVCAGTQVTLSNYNGVNDNTVKWYSDEECNSEVTEQVTLTDNDTKYYAKAYHAASGCYSSQYSTLTFTVNPLPTISIGDNTNAVKFEDVKLTATGNNIDDVTWTADKGTITVDATDPKKAILTYDQTGDVIVTAKAKAATGCESAEVRKKVTFGEEDCNSTTTTVQKPVGKVKITCTSKPSDWSKLYCYLWTTEGTKKEPLGTWGGKEIAVNSAQIVNVESKKFKIIFHNGRGTQTADSQELNPDKIYNLKINYANNSHTISVEEKGTYKEPVEETVDPEITAPAAKTISVSTTEGEGNIIFSGQVVKTGCANALTYGFAYSTDANADKSNWTKVACVNTGNTAGTQYNGEKTGIEVDGTYYVCAYITNSAGTTYGAVTEITISTTKTPISNVTLNYCDKNGGNVGVDPNPMCKGATAYVILDYTGSKYSDIKWLVEGVETNLVTDEGDGVWSYEIQGDGSLSVELKNDANTDPAWPYSNKLAFTIIPEPTAPYISIDPASGVICQGSSATIKVENPSADCSYKLVEERSKADFTPYKSGDLKYTVGSVGKYYVAAKHIACPTNEYTSNQVAINQIISTSAKISIEPAKAETTPWEPVSITVTADEGYVYEVTYTGNNLQDVKGVIIKQKGDTYTYYIPRPTGWGEGNAVSVRTPVAYGIKAQLKVDGEANQCNLSFDTATITVKDEEDEDCD